MPLVVPKRSRRSVALMLLTVHDLSGLLAQDSESKARRGLGPAASGARLILLMLRTKVRVSRKPPNGTVPSSRGVAGWPRAGSWTVIGEDGGSCRVGRIGTCGETERDALRFEVEASDRAWRTTAEGGLYRVE